MVDPVSNRRQLLEQAADLIDGDRNAQYGDPIDDFRRTSDYWNTHIVGVLQRRASERGVVVGPSTLDLIKGLLDPHDVAIMMNLLKISRLSWSPEKHDHWADMAGYAGCGWDCVVREHD